MMSEVLFRRQDGVGVITLNRPQKLNALSPGIREGLLGALREVDGDDATRSLLLTGEGRAFCAGGDVPNFPTGEAGRAAREARERDRRPASETSYVLAMRRSRRLIVGAINGYAVGAGFGLALACDIRIAAEDTRFAVFQPRRGVQPDGGLTYLLPRTVGSQKALELMVRGGRGEMIGAREALELGLVARVVPPGELVDTAMELARAIARGPSIAYALGKEGIYKGTEWDLEAAQEFEASAVSRCFATEDCHEGVRAFLEKREPVFRGR